MNTMSHSDEAVNTYMCRNTLLTGVLIHIIKMVGGPVAKGTAADESATVAD
jgi:hypothetical protein